MIGSKEKKNLPMLRRGSEHQSAHNDPTDPLMLPARARFCACVRAGVCVTLRLTEN